MSRQPQNVRNTNQVEEADNALLSVVSGGFEKRPPTQHLAKLNGLDTADEHAVMWIDRDSTEQYVVLVNPTDGTIDIHDAIDGSAVTVNVGDTKRYFGIEQTGVDITGIVLPAKRIIFDASETQLSWTVKLSDASTVVKIEGSVDDVTYNDIQTGITGASSTFNTTIDAVATGDHNYIRVTVTSAAGSADDTITVSAQFLDMTYLIEGSPFPEDFTLTPIADTSILVNKKAVTSMEEKDSGAVAGTVQEFNDLPTNGGVDVFDAEIYRVEGDDADNFDSYYVIAAVSGSDTLYSETSDPTQANFIAAYSMPHELVREADGTFTFRAATWNAREVGDDDLVPVPPFIGRSIGDVAFFGNRMAIAADESIYLGQQGDLFDMWPEKAIQQQDTDPIDRSASTNQVNILEWLVVFRKLLFSTSGIAQFELAGAGAQLTPTTASFDRATNYPASTIAKPEAMGDLLYFASATPVSSVIYEYLFDEASLSNTAIDVSRHVNQYIPTSITHITSDPTTGTVFVLSSGESNSVFIYRVFFDGQTKVQSAWAKYKLGETTSDAFIQGMQVLSGFLVLVVERTDGVFLEQIQIERETIDTDLGFIPLIDQRTVITGVYNGGTDTTTFTTPYEHDDDLVVITGGDFTVPGTELVVSYPTSTTATISGDFSDGPVYAGRPYTMNVELSKQYFRPAEDSPAILNGRFQLRDITFSHKDTGYYKVVVTPLQRDPNTYEFTGRILGSGSNVISGTAIEESGEFTAGVLSDGLTAKIQIQNDTPFPSIVTSASMRAFFNETSRQG